MWYLSQHITTYHNYDKYIHLYRPLSTHGKWCHQPAIVLVASRSITAPPRRLNRWPQAATAHAAAIGAGASQSRVLVQTKLGDSTKGRYRLWEKNRFSSSIQRSPHVSAVIRSGSAFGKSGLRASCIVICMIITFPSFLATDWLAQSRQSGFQVHELQSRALCIDRRCRKCNRTWGLPLIFPSIIKNAALMGV